MHKQQQHKFFLGSYNGSSTLPMVLAGSADLDAVKACFNDPASTTCRGIIFILYITKIWLRQRMLYRPLGQGNVWKV